MTRYPLSRDDYRDALGWLYATHREDDEGRMVIASDCDPPGLLDALTMLLLGLARVSTNGQPELYLDHLGANLDRLLDDAGID